MKCMLLESLLSLQTLLCCARTAATSAAAASTTQTSLPSPLPAVLHYGHCCPISPPPYRLAVASNGVGLPCAECAAGVGLVQCGAAVRVEAHDECADAKRTHTTTLQSGNTVQAQKVEGCRHQCCIHKVDTALSRLALLGYKTPCRTIVTVRQDKLA
jgi:hypothetical protein